jgi:hypothetical protein
MRYYPSEEHAVPILHVQVSRARKETRSSGKSQQPTFWSVGYIVGGPRQHNHTCFRVQSEHMTIIFVLSKMFTCLEMGHTFRREGLTTTDKFTSSGG